MAENGQGTSPPAVDTALGDMKIEETGSPLAQVPDTLLTNGSIESHEHTSDIKNSPSTSPKNSASQSPVKMESATQTPKTEVDEQEATVEGDITVKLEPGKAPKLSRKSSQKVISRSPPLFDHLPDATDEASSCFQVIRDCIYGSKYMGASEHDALGCDCSEEWS